jgi:hypothetical protein
MNNLVERMDKSLKDIKCIMSISSFKRFENILTVVSDVCTPISAVIGTLIFLTFAIKTDSLQIFVVAFAWAPLLAVLYFIAIKMKKACRKTLKNNPSSIASQEFLDVLTVIYLVLSVAVLFAALFYSVKVNSWFVLGYGMAAFFGLVYAAWLMAQPALITTNILQRSTGGTDAIAILVMGSKIYLRSVNLVVGLASLVGLVLLANTFYEILVDPNNLYVNGLWSLLSFFVILIGLLSPLIIYVTFVLGYLVLDVLRSILSLSPNDNQKPEAGMDTLTDQQEDQMESVASDGLVKMVSIIILMIILVAFSLTKGKEMYAEYQIKSEIAKIERENKIAQERERLERVRIESQRKESYRNNARQYIGKKSIDLIRDQEINAELNILVGRNMAIFEEIFSVSEPVIEASGLLLAKGCRANMCDQFKGLVVVDLSQTKTYAVVLAGGEVRYLGVNENEIPSDVRRWVASN